MSKYENLTLTFNLMFWISFKQFTIILKVHKFIFAFHH
jgi:hypothetical protein